MKRSKLIFLISGILLFGVADAAKKVTKVKESFSFIVFGDSRGSKPLEIPETYTTILDECNTLETDFVVHVGDHIMGYTSDMDELRKEWEEVKKINSVLKMPFFPVPGNHEYSDSLTRKFFLEYNQRGDHYSFDFKGWHFVVLNTEELGHTDSIVGAQLEWLKDDLAKAMGTFKEKSKVKSRKEKLKRKRQMSEGIFVFLHKPLWRYERTGEDRHWMENVHPILVKNKVKAVFAGHWHHYEFSEIDGIKYFITGGAGAPLSDPKSPETGNFFHYVLVKIDKGIPKILVMKAGSVMRENVVLSTDVKNITQLKTESFSIPYLNIPQKSVKQDIAISISNPLNEPLAGKAVWKTEEMKDWKIEPKEANLNIPGKGKGSFSFKFNASNVEFYPVPMLEVKTKYGKTEITIEREIRLVPNYDCITAKKPVKIDGEIKDWEGVKRISLDRKEYFKKTGMSEDSWKGASDLSGEISFQWDSKNLYVLGEIKDDKPQGTVAKDKPFRGDALLLSIDGGVGKERFEKQIKESQSLVMLAFSSTPEKLPKAYFYESLKGKKEGETKDVEVIAKRNPKDNSIVYESAIPWSEIVTKPPKSGDVILLDIAISDNDGKERKGWLQWTPGALEKYDSSYFGEVRLK